MKLFFGPLVPPVRGSIPRASGGKVREGSKLHGQQYKRSSCLNHMTSHVLGEERSLWG